jgi:hypothetical protein
MGRGCIEELGRPTVVTIAAKDMKACKALRLDGFAASAQEELGNLPKEYAGGQAARRAGGPRADGVRWPISKVRKSVRRPPRNEIASV